MEYNTCVLEQYFMHRLSIDFSFTHSLVNENVYTRCIYIYREREIAFKPLTYFKTMNVKQFQNIFFSFVC